MGLKRAIEYSESGIRANALQMQLIAGNIANAQTTRSQEGGPYQRRTALFAEVPFATHLKKATERTEALRLVKVWKDPTLGELVYQPGHPDADASGFIRLPNVSLIRETTELTWISQLHNANIQALNTSRQMGQDLMRLLQQ